MLAAKPTTELHAFHPNRRRASSCTTTSRARSTRPCAALRERSPRGGRQAAARRPAGALSRAGRVERRQLRQDDGRPRGRAQPSAGRRRHREAVALDLGERPARHRRRLHFQAERALKDLILELLAQWDEHDLFLCPTGHAAARDRLHRPDHARPEGAEPPSGDHLRLYAAVQLHGTATAISRCRSGQSSDGLPIGMMFGGALCRRGDVVPRRGAARGGDAPWRDRRPPVWG